MRMRDRKIGTKVMLGYGVVLALFIGVTALVYRNATRLIEDFQWVAHTNSVMGKGAYLLKLLVDMETGERGFLVTGKEEFLEPYIRGKAEFPVELSELRKQVSDNPEQVERLRRVETLVERWDREAGSPEIAKRREVNAGRASLAEVAALLEAKTGKGLMDELRRILDEFQSTEQKLLQVRQARAQEAARYTITTALAGTLLAVIAALLIGLSVTRGITVPLARAVGVADRLAEGDLGVEVEVERGDEVGRLQGAMRRMVERLRQVV
ncbi:MAG TPA: CHASE3 domain-containing protein, partial [Thermodesulfobacteriota bacterium]|nr:CHASE3 domain-containing protein [Thermodesulfobacteriota bacterium]